MHLLQVLGPITHCAIGCIITRRLKKSDWDNESLCEDHLFDHYPLAHCVVPEIKNVVFAMKNYLGAHSRITLVCKEINAHLAVLLFVSVLQYFSYDVYKFSINLDNKFFCWDSTFHCSFIDQIEMSFIQEGCSSWCNWFKFHFVYNSSGFYDTFICIAKLDLH